MSTYTTPYALKFGGPAPNNQFGSKSGLTPLPARAPDVSFPSTTPGAPARLAEQTRDAIIAYQRLHLEGFTTAQLLDLDAITERSLRVSDLAGAQPLCRLLERRHWERAAAPLERPGMTGGVDILEVGDVPGLCRDVVCVAEDELVWAALKPSLLLASALIGNLSSSPWVDALFNGKRVAIEQSRIADADQAFHDKGNFGYGNQLHSFHLRPPEDFGSDDQARNALSNMLDHELANKLKFCIRDAADLIRKENEKYLPMACMEMVRDERSTATGIILCLSTQLLAQLLNGDLNDAERLTLQFMVAQTIVHEMIHAFSHALIWFQRRLSGGYFDWETEPYFEQEQFPEVGDSMAQATYGGTPRWILEWPAQEIWALGLPPLGAMTVNFPNAWLSGSQKQDPNLLIPPKKTPYYIPLPVSYYEALLSRDFWAVHFRSWGMLKAPDPIVANYVDNKGVKRSFSVFDDDMRESALAGALKTVVALDRVSREAHVVLMKQNIIASYVPMVERRAASSQQLIDRYDYYHHTTRDAESWDISIIPAVIELLTAHIAIVNYVLDMEDAAGSRLHTVRLSVQDFNYKFWWFLEQAMKDSKLTDAQSRRFGIIKRLLRSLDLNTFTKVHYSAPPSPRPESPGFLLQIPEMGSPAPESPPQRRAPTPVYSAPSAWSTDRELLNAIDDAFNGGDQAASKEAIDRVTSSLETTAAARLLARLKLARLDEVISLEDRIKVLVSIRPASKNIAFDSGPSGYSASEQTALKDVLNQDVERNLTELQTALQRPNKRARIWTT